MVNQKMLYVPDHWEYDLFVADHGVGLVTVLEGLNNRGVEGWECFAIEESHVTVKLYFWLRRRVVRLEPVG